MAETCPKDTTEIPQDKAETDDVAWIVNDAMSLMGLQDYLPDGFVVRSVSDLLGVDGLSINGVPVFHLHWRNGETKWLDGLTNSDRVKIKSIITDARKKKDAERAKKTNDDLRKVKEVLDGHEYARKLPGATS